MSNNSSHQASTAIDTEDSNYNWKNNSSLPTDYQLDKTKLKKKVFPKSGSDDNGWFYPTLSNCTDKGEFVIYRGSNVNVLFGESVQENVSEACLVNDHFILVKMPDASMRKKPPSPIILGEDSDSATIRGKPILERQVYKGTATVVKYLKANRINRKVAPIEEESPESVIIEPVKPNEATEKSNTLRSRAKRFIRSCWAVDDKVEIFATKTQIEGKFLNSLLETQTPKLKDFNVEQMEPLDLTLPKPSVARDCQAENAESMELSASIRNLRDHFKVKNDSTIEVILEPRGHLITNESESNMFLSSLGSAAHKAKAATSSKVKLGRTFYWLSHPFLGRPKTKKPKKKINAIVHKTYFLRWSKPPDTKWHGYGVERPADDIVPITRCRSAIF